MKSLMSKTKKQRQCWSMVMEVSASWYHSGRGLIRGTARWSSISYKGKGWNMAHLPKPPWREVFVSFWGVYQNLHLPLDGAGVCGVCTTEWMSLFWNSRPEANNEINHAICGFVHFFWISSITITASLLIHGYFYGFGQQSGIDWTLHITLKILLEEEVSKISCSINKIVNDRVKLLLTNLQPLNLSCANKSLVTKIQKILQGLRFWLVLEDTVLKNKTNIAGKSMISACINKVSQIYHI